MEFFDKNNLDFLLYNYEKQPRVFALQETVLNYIDLTVCLSGEMHYILDSEHIVLSGGDAILLPQGCRRVRFETNKPALYASFNIQFKKAVEFENVGLIKNCVTPSIIMMLDCFKKDFSTPSKNKKEKCLAIFQYIYYKIIEDMSDEENVHVRIIKQYISDNLTGDITLDGIAKHVHLAPPYICSLFKKQVGETVMQYVIKLRIDLAKRLLVSQIDPIYVIAEMCGFSDYNYFSHTFRKVTGMSAASFRKARQYASNDN